MFKNSIKVLKIILDIDTIYIKYQKGTNKVKKMNSDSNCCFKVRVKTLN